jgi:hypothetical protein
MSPDHSDDIQAELAALADGTLPAARRAELLARASPAQRESLERQRAALASVRALEVVHAPAALRGSIEGSIGAAPQRVRRRAARLRLAGAGALAAAVVLVLAFGGGGAHTPTALEATRVALEPATAASPAEDPHDRALLAISVEGLPFPYWGGARGWPTAGARTDRLDGRTITTIFYAAGGRRIGYAIVAGTPLALPSAGAVVDRGGVRFHVLDAAGATVVTWRAAGHTCILAARGVPAHTLLELAS